MLLNKPKVWRDSASLILLARNSAADRKNNYDILVFKRPSKSSFMANSLVYPGGATDKCDQHTNWIECFKSLGVTDGKLKEVCNVSGPRPVIFQKESDNDIAREISLRITAIRETFEELGVLMCKTKPQLDDDRPITQSFKDLDIEHWQKIVHDDPSQFITLCKEHKVVPDIWQCFEWANWLTPTALGKKRFNTAFFIMFLAEKPNVLPEKHEVTEFAWRSPEEILRMYKNEEIWIPPPQIYETSRLITMTNMEDLAKFSYQRRNHSVMQMYPVMYPTNDGYIATYPGDDLYPKNPDLFNNPDDMHNYEHCSIDQLRTMAKNLHRGEHLSDYHSEIVINIPISNHLKPIKKLGAKL